MKRFLLRSLNQIGWSYAYLGLLYAVYFIYWIAVPAYRQDDELSSGRYILFNVIFFYFFGQGYWYLILTSFTPVRSKTNSSDRSFFCYLCQRTIPIQDHHCFFVGRCIGEHNQRYFLLMLFHLFLAHLIGYSFVCDFLWREIGGFSLRSVFFIPFFNVAYLIGFCQSKWQAWIAFHHYLVYFDFVFIGKLLFQLIRRSRNGQTQYEEKKAIRREKQNFQQIFHCRSPFRLLLPLLPN